MMGLASFLSSARNIFCNCRYVNRRTPKKLYSSYFMHVVVLAVVLHFSVEFALAERKSDPQTHPKFVTSTNDAKFLSPSNTDHEATRESQRTLPGSTDFLKDVKKDDSNSEGLSPESKGLFFGEDSNGVPIVIGTWFRYGSYTLAFCMFGTAFLVACVASAIYYVLFVVTEPSQQVRSMDNEEGWTVSRVLRALQLAYETYETFDPYSPSCQLKTVCEIQESGYFQGSMLKRLTHFIIHSDLVQKRMSNAADLQAADRIGNDPEEACIEKFPKCRFSLSKTYEKYLTM